MRLIIIGFLLSQISLTAINGLHLWAEIEYGRQRPLAASAIYRWEDKYLFLQAMLDLRADQPRGAVKDLGRLLEFSPYNIDAVNNLGVAYWMLDDFQEAEKWFRRALVMAPEYRWAKENLDILNGRRPGAMNIMAMAK